MLLSVIIVNYNVKHFLEQCLFSVQKASRDMQAEIIVVDNNSSDNSLAYLKPRFPLVRFICNNENQGFAKACNQGLALSTGRYVLFLNPDTIVPEDCFVKCIAFLESHPDAGAAGIRMVDGKGCFLKESKRAFPSPLTSLFKLSGLARAFPASGTFARYHLGHLQENSNHEIDVLAGAFLMIKRVVLKKTGSFDEKFFMYGEDVDLSYRIQEAGYKNFYFSEASIIHFKGESTRKGSMNYVRMFYTAMSLFVSKHYGGSRAGIFNLLIHVAIWIRAFLSAIGRFIRQIGLPLLDAALILFSFWMVKTIWSNFVKTDTEYSNRLLVIAFPVFTCIYLVTAYYAGLYDRWYKRSQLISSTLIATIVLLAGYSLLPEQYRFSRAIVLFGAVLSFVLISVLRWLLIKTDVLGNNRQKPAHAGTLIVGTASEYETARQLMKESGIEERILGRIAVHSGDHPVIGHIGELKKIAVALPVNEIIFCEGTLSFREIIGYMPALPRDASLKFHAAGSESIVGSDSKDRSGESLSKENGFNLSNPYNRRIKRLIDVSVAVSSLITFPFQLLIVKKPLKFLENIWYVIIGRRSWVGYATSGKNLPSLRPGVLAFNGIPVSSRQELPAESLLLMDYWYAKDFEPVNDLKLIWKFFVRLGG